MRALLQRVLEASVTIDGQVVGAIDRGLLVLLGFTHTDEAADVDWMVRKVCDLRLFDDADGRMNLDLTQVQGGLLVVSQFTLYGDVRRGRRPAFTDAMAPDRAEALYDLAVARFRARGVPVETGRFGAMMQVRLLNDGPVTLPIESPPRPTGTP
jgi:D-tyrosyl-tRNA(Tyr) deacylase